MIPSDTSWSGLEVGKIDTRRVDASARRNWFWTVMPGADVALVLQLSSLPEPTPDLPKLKNLDIRCQTLPGGPIFYIRLKDLAQLSLFETLCRDVMAAGELGESEADSLDRAIRRTFRWQHLLRGGQSEGLSEEEQKGLIGEIEILRFLIDSIGMQSALAAWMGPSGAPKDFELPHDCIEVKARRGASKPFVSIANEYQLSDVPGKRIWLAVLAVDKVQPPHGLTLASYIAALTEIIATNAPSALNDWDLHLADAGFDAAHDYSTWRWIVSEPTFHQVVPGFPRVCARVPLGVSDISYAVALSACEPFRVDWQDVKARIVGGCAT